MATLVPEFISVLRDIRDIKYPDIVTKHGQVEVNAALVEGYNSTYLGYVDSASASANSALINKNATDANVITTNNNVATTNADASTCTAKALIANQILAMTASASTLVAGSQASASFNPTTGVMSFGIPTGPKGDRGDAFVVNAFGLLANRTTYDGQPVSFSFYSTDAGLIYFKLSNTSGDWSTGVPFGKGDTGDAGNGITSITLTGTVGSVDTYRILFTDATFFDFNVTNGSVTSVAGRTGAITLTKTDVGLSNVDNTSDLLKPLSTAEINALALKANLNSPALTGTPTAPTPTAGTNTTQLATTEFVLANAPTVTIASTAEAQAGTDNTKVITPLRLREGLNANGTAPIYACRAWVNFNGTGTVAIRASGNVSSITDNGAGNYTVNFITAMPDAKYSWSIDGQYYGGVGGFIATDGTLLTSSIKLLCVNTAMSSTFDNQYISLTIFR